jgi:hypothetical protein
MPYIGRSTDGFGVRNRFLYLASADDTSVSGADANGATLTFSDGAYVDVYLNGVLLKAGTDYNTNTANTIAGLSAMAANDEVTVIVYDVFTVGDMVSATSGGTFVGNVNFSGNIDVDGTANLDAVDIDGALTQDGGAVFNEASADVDFRVESNGNANMINVDGGNDRVGIGISPGFNVQIDKSSTNTTLTDLTDAQLVLSNTGSATTNQHVKLGFRFQDGSLNGQAMIAAVREANDARSTSLRFYSAPSSDGDPDEAIRIDSNGHVTMPKQPAFHVTGSTQNNVTHNADFYPLKGSGSVIYDVNSDVSLSDNVGFSPGNVHFFVAPVTGKYMFECRLRFDNMTADISYISTSIVTSNRAHGVNMHSTNYFDATASYHSHQGTVIADLDAGDSAYIIFYIAGGTTGTDLDSHSFKGILIA